MNMEILPFQRLKGFSLSPREGIPFQQGVSIFSFFQTPCFLSLRVNITYGAFEERTMLSGLHIVADIFCCFCGQIVGWKYESAHARSQKYKEGKFVLERGRIVDEEVELPTEFFIDTHANMSDAEDV